MDKDVTCYENYQPSLKAKQGHLMLSLLGAGNSVDWLQSAQGDFSYPLIPPSYDQLTASSCIDGWGRKEEPLYS